MTPDLCLAAVMDVFRGAVMGIFILSGFLVILVVLLQEGKGGGIAGAFGGAGAETFGVKAGTVNKFTAWLAALFLGLALLHAGLSTADTGGPSKPNIEGIVPEEDAAAGEDGDAKGSVVADPDKSAGDQGDEDKGPKKAK